METIQELRERAENKQKRGKSITFSDGKEWVIPTMPLKLNAGKIADLSEKAMAHKISTKESIELVGEIVKLNYPEAKDEDINPDLESMRDVIMQYTGQYLGK